MIESLNFNPLLNNPSLVSESVFREAAKFSHLEILVAQIDPAFMGGKEFCEHYGVNPSDGANCIIAEAVKGEIRKLVAIVTPVGQRTDLNGSVKRHLGVSRVSLAPLDEVLQKTNMEYGSITPFGLPDDWMVLVDDLLMKKEKIIVGGGKQISKVLLPISYFMERENTEVYKNDSKKD